MGVVGRGLYKYIRVYTVYTPHTVYTQPHIYSSREVCYTTTTLYTHVPRLLVCNYCAIRKQNGCYALGDRKLDIHVKALAHVVLGRPVPILLSCNNILVIILYTYIKKIIYVVYTVPLTSVFSLLV